LLLQQQILTLLRLQQRSMALGGQAPAAGAPNAQAREARNAGKPATARLAAGFAALRQALAR